MGLKIYDVDKTEVSIATMMNPLRTYHDGRNSSIETVKFYIRNDDPVLWYQQVQVLPIDSTGYDDTIGEYGTGFSVKLAYGTVEPLPHEWDLVNAGEAVALPSDIGTSLQSDTTTYYPVWLRISVPGGTRAQNKQDIALRLGRVQRPVTV